ncbi:ferredoxin [Amycolatopsis rhabdoformis]|uniref:Ferredoxin n=1 Tax=Amycolatopsis rhabdoformis TaxID=1448059 RepID=A0ABZ1IJ71_9PSEU|nr:ferredoxin [Amycolatopsis rhabdoformis]WSE34224.1 ferredoxin [Amycolatopsis rhabdoformis]
MKIGQVPDVCQGHAQCYIIDADLFPLNEDGFSGVGPADEVPPGEEDIAEMGVEACPVAALRVLP